MNVPGPAGDLRLFEAGDIPLRSGACLTDARLVYAVHGTLNEARDNAVLLPTFYGGTHEDVQYLIGSDKALDPDRYCIVVPNLFGNGISTSPSNASGEFPLVTIHDNVSIQHRLATEVLGIVSFELVIGFSMGGQQAYEWACRFPKMVHRLAVLCSAARTSPHTWVFLDGVKAALCAGGSLEPGSRGAEIGKRALARVWAGWGLSAEWYRQRLYEQNGQQTLEDYLRKDWQSEFAQWDARDLLAMIETWQAHDIGGSTRRDSDYVAAMGKITGLSLVMPSSSDLYFPPEDSSAEVALLTDARLAVIPSIYGHAAGGGGDPADLAFIEAEIRALLRRR